MPLSRRPERSLVMAGGSPGTTFLCSWQRNTSAQPATEGEVDVGPPRMWTRRPNSAMWCGAKHCRTGADTIGLHLKSLTPGLREPVQHPPVVLDVVRLQPGLEHLENQMVRHLQRPGHVRARPRRPLVHTALRCDGAHGNAVQCLHGPFRTCVRWSSGGAHFTATPHTRAEHVGSQCGVVDGTASEFNAWYLTGPRLALHVADGGQGRAVVGSVAQCLSPLLYSRMDSHWLTCDCFTFDQPPSPAPRYCLPHYALACQGLVGGGGPVGLRRRTHPPTSQ